MIHRSEDQRKEVDEEPPPTKGPRTNWPHNSWVTGDSPAVQSLYSRVLARNATVRGNVQSP